MWIAFPRPYRTTLLFALFVATILLSSCASRSSDTKPSRVVATVDGAPIIVPELQYFMSLNRSAVYNHFYRTHQATYDDDFWTSKFGDTTPLEILKKRSLQEAIRYKVQHKVARDLGLSTTRHYDSLMADRVRVNAQRARRSDRGEPVYGPVHLTPRAYFSRVREDMVLATKKALSQTEFKIPTARLKALYADYRDSLTTVRDGHGRNPVSRSFDAFAAVHQRDYTAEQYEKRVDQLTSTAQVTLDSTVFKRVRFKEK